MNINAFTFKLNVKSSGIITSISVRQSSAYCDIFKLNSKQVDALALWDTGATNSCISKGLARHLKLTAVEKCEVIGVHGIEQSNVYLTDILLPNKLTVANVRMTEFFDTIDFDIIIGLDIITLGDFSITGYNNKSVFSFRLPSRNNPVDFTIAD